MKCLYRASLLICETQPKSLSQSVSGRRKLDPDIETIVGKALEKDAERRYPSAAALSEDIDRYLTSQPILARPPSTTYQLRKFAKRNKALVGGIAATFLVLVAGIVVSTVLGLREVPGNHYQHRKSQPHYKIDCHYICYHQECLSNHELFHCKNLMYNLLHHLLGIFLPDNLN